MKLPTDRQTADAIHRAASSTGWTDETALIDIACENLAQSRGGVAASYERIVRLVFERDFKIWGAC